MNTILPIGSVVLLKNATWEKSVLPDGTIVYDINASGILQRFSFTEI